MVFFCFEDSVHYLHIILYILVNAVLELMLGYLQKTIKIVSLIKIIVKKFATREDASKMTN